jgi:hypothetical protein
MKEDFMGPVPLGSLTGDRGLSRGYPIIFCGDHAEFEAEWAASGRPDSERPDWPLPSFDAHDWAAAFCKIANGFGFKDANGKPLDEGWMITWFANALMRGYDQRSSEVHQLDLDVRCERGCTLKKVNKALSASQTQPR